MCTVCLCVCVQSHVTALDANNQELQRRVSELTSRLDQSQTEAQKHKLGEQNVRDTLMEVSTLTHTHAHTRRL